MPTPPTVPGIRLTLRIPERVRAGIVVPIIMLVENTSAKPLELYVRGREMTCDFVVRAPGGDIVWRRLEGEVIPAILRLEVLLPAQPIAFRDSWDQVGYSGDLVAPGVYSVTGAVLTDESSTLESAAITLRID